MDNYRQIQGQDYGILRKKDGKEEELFVFGYSCKIYEDYDKSLYVDQGKHLIPWLGDETLKIDRYDCRGALSDLTPYLPKSEGFDRRIGLSNEEKRIEALCDQERFRALNVNEEEILHQEEELKRLQMAINAENSYNEIGFNYDENDKNERENTLKESNEEDDEEPFIPPYQLDVPVGMKIPKSRKHHEIIEKTAFFINDQGIQMEILLKMKQADNPQFNFLSFDNDLHPYYRHMLNAIKSQRYKQTQPSAATETAQETAQEESYLHPALASSTTSFSLPESAPKIPTISYKPSENCLYSALVNRIKESQNTRLDLISIEDQKKKEHIGLENPIYDPSVGLNSSSLDQNDENAQSCDSLPLSSLTKSARRRRIRKEKNKAAIASFKIYYAEEEVSVPVEESSSPDNTVDEVPTTETEPVEEAGTLKPVPAPAPVIEVPPTEMQLIIDKMASYVAKNGRSFEDVVRAKEDPRFAFLDHAHVHNPYYNQKVQLYLQLENVNKLSACEPNQTEHSRRNPTIKKSHLKSKQTKQPNPICFAIKKPKDQEMLEMRSALPGEESEIEEAEKTGIKAELEDEEKVDDLASSISAPSSPPLTSSDIDPITELVTEVTSPVKKINDTMMEKWDQERIKAKLFTAAKEKLAAKAREKDAQLQAERRKKAMEFINSLQEHKRIQTNDSTIASSAANGKTEEKDVITIPSESSSTDSDSVISVPFCGEGESKAKSSKRKYRDTDDLQEKIKKRRDYSDEKKKHRKSKHRSRTRSPSGSRHSHKKYDKNDKKHRKRKHHHRRSRSPSYRKTVHKTSHKRKRSNYSDDDSSSSSHSERY